MKTNADLIRSMTDEELAMCLYEIGYDEGWDEPKYALKWLQQSAEEAAMRLIDADVVPVVRCKDCKWLYDEMGDYWCRSHRGLVRICENSFCSYGERKENN